MGLLLIIDVTLSYTAQLDIIRVTQVKLPRGDVVPLRPARLHAALINLAFRYLELEVRAKEQ